MLRKKISTSTRFSELMNLSIYTAPTTARSCRLPLIIGLLPLPVDPIQMAMTCSFRSTALHPLHHYYEAVFEKARGPAADRLAKVLIAI